MLEMAIVFLVCNALSFWIGHHTGYHLAQWRSFRFVEILSSWFYTRVEPEQQAQFKREIKEFLERYGIRLKSE